MPALAYGISMVQGLVWQTSLHRPLFQGSCHPAKFALECGSAVIDLLLLRSPPAILGRVAGVVVDAINRHAARGRTHVGQKVLKYLPPFADLNPATPVIGKRHRVRIFTSLSHAAPDIVDRRMGHSVRSAVPRMHVAATRIGPAVAKVCTINHFAGPARTEAFPHCASARAAAGISDHLQKPKPFARQVDSLFFHLTRVRHIGLLYQYKLSQPSNKRCWGVWTRQLNRYNQCMEAQ